MWKKYFLNQIIVIACMSLSANNLSAQVKSTTFNVTLKLLLNSNTPVINVADAALAEKYYFFLDARELNEYNISRLQNARWVGDKTFDIKSIKDLAKNKPIIVYCSIGKRSEKVAIALNNAGYTNVKNLYGGIFEWVNAGHKVYNNKHMLTDSVHAYNHFWGQWLSNGIKVYDK